MKKINLFVVVFLSFGSLLAQALEEKANLFKEENVECAFHLKTEKSKDEVFPMTKGTLNGMVGTLTGYFAAFEKDGISYLVTASTPIVQKDMMILNAEVTITNTNKGQYGDGMMKGAILLTKQSAYGFVGSTYTEQKSSKFVSTSQGVVCSIPALVKQ